MDVSQKAVGKANIPAMTTSRDTKEPNSMLAKRQTPAQTEGARLGSAQFSLLVTLRSAVKWRLHTVRVCLYLRLSVSGLCQLMAATAS